MQTHFTLAQLADPAIKDADDILRRCVHCGFCTATCPTYTLLGDELDSPRGRIYLIKDMLEKNKPAGRHLTKHMDRCLGCLSCMTACPSGVDYMHLMNMARVGIEKTYRRPLAERLLRGLLKTIIPHPGLFRLALWAAWFCRPLAPLLPGRLAGLVRIAPRRIQRGSDVDRGQIFQTGARPAGRVLLMGSCAQKVLSPGINEATVHLLQKMNMEVVIPDQGGCCGALAHHMGDEKIAHKQARINIETWIEEMDAPGGLEAILINASGCGTVVKDYGYMFRYDPEMAEKAKKISNITRDITEFIDEKGLPEINPVADIRVAYHSACSMQHGQKLSKPPVELLKQAGYEVVEPPESHLCCGSAGTYNMLQPKLANKLRERKIKALYSVTPDVVATGNIGCISQLANGMDKPVVHTVQLLDWATGGKPPDGLG